MSDSERQLLWREFRLLALLAVVAAAAAAFVAASGVFLLAFAGVLMAIILRDPSTWLARHSFLSPPWALALVVVLLLGMFALLGWLAAPRVAEQAATFAERLPSALNTIEELIARRLGRDAAVDVAGALPDAERLLGMVPNIVTTTFGVLGSMVMVTVVGIYLAAHPTLYRDGFVRLFRPHHRAGVTETLNQIGNNLTRWMRGQLISMVVVGILSYISLRLLGVPLALTLALITGVLEFVPYLGAIVAAVPVILVASTESWTLAAWALLVYTGIQSLEGYLMIPLIQRRAISVPPAVILLSQVLLGVLFGVIGIVLATPLTAAAAVVVRQSYIDEVLERDEPA